MLFPACSYHFKRGIHLPPKLLVLLRLETAYQQIVGLCYLSSLLKKEEECQCSDMVGEPGEGDRNACGERGRDGFLMCER